MARVGFIRTVNAVAISGAGTGCGQVAMPDFVGVFGELDPLEFGFPGVVEQAKLDLGRMSREQREVDAEAAPVCAQRKRLALSEPRAARSCGGPRQGVV